LDDGFRARNSHCASGGEGEESDEGAGEHFKAVFFF